MPRNIAQVGLFVSLLMTTVSEVNAQSNSSFKAAVGGIGSGSFAFGVELWALSEIQLLPEYNVRVETVEVAKESDRLKSLQEGRTQFAIIRGTLSAPEAVDLRSIIAHQPKGVVGTPLQLVTRADMPEETVYRITSIIFDHAAYISGNTMRKGIEVLGHAMTGLSLPVHPGAIDFFEDQAETFSAIFRHGEEEALQLKEACIDAAARGEAAHFIGHDEEPLCDVALLMPTEYSTGQGGPMAIVDHHNAEIAPENNALAFQPTM